MGHRAVCGAVAMALVALACSCGPVASPRLERVVAAPDGKGFVGAESGRRFAPRGFNYDRDWKSRLLEDYWGAEWPTVVKDFREMKALGANVVRIHLQVARFMDGPDRPNAASLDRLGRLVALAEEIGLYLDVTGLGCYRRADVPGWYRGQDEAGRWRTQERFWEAVAARCATSPAIFCYDLINEPVVQAGRETDWLAGDMGGFTYCQRLALDPAGRSPADITRQWIGRMAAAIRRHDPQHLITVGLLPFPGGGTGLTSRELGQLLDLLCVHIYPASGKMPEARKTVEGFAGGKPVVIEEIFPLACSAPELGRFLEDVRPHVAGWIGFYWGKTPEELSRSGEIGDAMTLGWLRLFQEMKP
jgi:hypothetical protein